MGSLCSPALLATSSLPLQTLCSCTASKTMELRPLTAAGLVLACTLHCMVGAADLSSSKSWLCGVWITGDELSAPLARYFNFPQLFRTKCPIEKDTRKFAKLCQKVGGQWEKSWSPTKRGFRGLEGDNVCKAVQKELGVDDVPNELFPKGIRLGYFYNFCGIDEWTFSGLVRQGDSLCCKDGSYISCDGIVETSGSPTGSLFSGGHKFLDIFVGNKSVIPFSEDTEPQYFGPVEFKLEIANNENIILSQTIPFSSIQGEDGA